MAMIPLDIFRAASTVAANNGERHDCSCQRNSTGRSCIRRSHGGEGSACALDHSWILCRPSACRNRVCAGRILLDWQKYANQLIPMDQRSSPTHCICHSFMSAIHDGLLGLAMWTKQKIVKEVRYSRFRTTVFWGFAGGLYPEALCQQMPQTEEWMGYIFLGWLIWQAIFPAVAAMFLCYRSHLRD